MGHTGKDRVEGVAICFRFSPTRPVLGHEKDGSAILREFPCERFHVEVLADGYRHIIAELRASRFDTWDWYQLARRADELAAVQNQASGLIALENLRERWSQVGVVPYEHQIRTAERVIHEMHGQAILADEVGLGKTIEAGLILKEYMLRGLAKKVLILPPRTWSGSGTKSSMKSSG